MLHNVIILEYELWSPIYETWKCTSQRRIKNSHDVAQDYFILTGLIRRKMSSWKIEKRYVSELYLSARKQKH